MKKLILTTTIITILIFVLSVFNSKKIQNQQTASSDTTIEADEKTQGTGSSITLISTGDVGLVRDINSEIQKRKDPNYPFLNIAEYLRNADLTITNLEGPLIDNCPIILTGFKFCGEDTNVKGLVFAGIDAASLANNHTTNYGLEGMRQTASILKSSNIKPFGLDNGIEYIEVKNKKVALLGFVELGNNWPGLNNAAEDNVAKQVAEAKTKADIVITAFHWGAEYTRRPTQNQVNLAHLAIDNGADIVLGNHPHWIQVNEIYKDKFITYAQGNTIFDQDWSQETKEGVIYKFEYRDGKFRKVDEKYTVIVQNVQPRFAYDEEKFKILKKLSESKN